MTQVLKRRSCQADTGGMNSNPRHVVTMQFHSVIFSPILWVGYNHELALRSILLFVRLNLSLTVEGFIVPIRDKLPACSVILLKGKSHVTTVNLAFIEKMYSPD